MSKTISESSQTAIREFLAAWWGSLMWQAHETVAGAQLPHVPPAQLYDQLFGLQLREIAAAAEGLLPDNEVTRGETLEAVQSVCEWMFARPGMPSAYHIPPEWWETPVGWLCLRAHVWARGDELITLSEAERISGESLSSLSQRIDRGALTGYRVPAEVEPNPQRRTRVLRSEIAQR